MQGEGEGQGVGIMEGEEAVTLGQDRSGGEVSWGEAQCLEMDTGADGDWSEERLVKHARWKSRGKT